MHPNIILLAILLAKSLVLLGVLLAVGLGTYAMIRRLAPHPDYRFTLFGIALIVGPILMIWLFTILLHIAPGQHAAFYLILPLVPFLGFTLFGLSQARQDLGSSLSKFFTRPAIGLFNLGIGLSAFVCLVFGLGGLVALAIAVPANANDPLEYFSLARHLAETRNGWVYPIIDSEATDGFTARWTHPLGYINLLTYSYLLQGTGETSFVARFVAPYFAFALAILLIAFAGFRRKVSGLLTALFLVSTPLFYGLVVQYHIDPTRIAAFTAAIAATWLVAQAPSVPRGLLAGLACGASMFCHSIGILTLPIALPIYILLARRARIWVHIVVVAQMLLLSLLMLSLRYSINMSVFGSPIADSVDIWSYPELGVEHSRLVERMMETPVDRLVNGAFMGFRQIDLFGPFYYVFVLALGVWLWRNRGGWSRPFESLRKQVWRSEADPALPALLVVLGYTGIMLLTLIAGTDLAVKNARYVLTMQPFLLIFAVRILMPAFFAEPEHRMGDGR